VAKKLFVKGNEALAMAAIRAGCRFYFGYPITPQNDIPEYLSRELPKAGGTFIQAESEIASINMLLGAAAVGARAMTSSSGPGISLKQEGISYMASCELPGVIVNVCRTGPGLGGIAASQGDYFQATRGGGHGDYRVIALGPNSAQEMYDLTILAFHLAEKYRTPVLILADSVLGQMQESLDVTKEYQMDVLPEKQWVLDGCKGRAPRLLKSLYLDGEASIEHNWKLYRKYQSWKEKEVRFEEVETEDAELLIGAYGSVARISKTSIRWARQKGLKVGLLRPITLFPFPEAEFGRMAEKVNRILVLEQNTGQMVEDVRLAVNGRVPVEFMGKPTGLVMEPEEILAKIESCFRDGASEARAASR
jgi:2-oxoglutarate ferredoxin oxidoreductase subunit alpha